MYERGFKTNEGGKNWWETSSGGHIEPIGGGLSALLKAGAGHDTDASRWIDSHRDLTFGTGDKPGILGTGQFNPEYYKPEEGASLIPGYDAFQQRLAQGTDSAGGRTGAQWGGTQMDLTQQLQMRARQMQLADMLQAQANGTGAPSVAELQMQRGLGQNMQQAMALAAATGNGQNAGGALRGIANQRSAMSQQNAADTGMLRAQEQQQAQNMYGQLLGGMRGQDIGWASGQAQLQQQTGLANMGSQMQQRQMNDQMVQFYLHSGMSLAQAQQQASMDLEKLRVQQNLAQTAQQAQAYEAAAQANANLTKSVIGAFTGGIGGGGGGIGNLGDGNTAGQVDTSSFMHGIGTQGP